MKCILRYLRVSLDEYFCFGVSDPILKGYIDVDIVGDLDNTKSNY